MNNIKSFDLFLEDDGGIAYSGSTNVGMGPVISAQPSVNSGSMIGSDWSSGGGTIGSGDISFPWNSSSNKMIFRKEKVKRFKDKKVNKFKRKSIKVLYDKPSKSKLMTFDNFIKNDLTKVNKIKDY